MHALHASCKWLIADLVSLMLQRCKHFEIGGDKKGKNQMY
jgi:hypothetical protein